ncbi:MAG: Ig-like domain-containing protein [Clostridia bacterium]|nr:Ig-like domain-containing protein [Clostridia bacterium]
MKKIDYKKHLPKIVITILILFFVVGLVWGLRSVLELEGTMEPNISKASLSPVPETKEALISYVMAAVEKAEAEKPALSFSDEFRIDDETMQAGDVQGTAAYIRSGIDDKLGEVRDDFSTGFGEDFSGKLWVPAIEPGDITSAELNYDFWKCPACGRETDEQPEVCEDCGTDAGFLLKHKDNYTITLHASDAVYPTAPASFFTRNFHPLTEAQINQLILDNESGWFECGNGFAITYRNLEICAVVNRLTDQIISLTYSEDVDFSTDVAFVGKYAALGTQAVSLTVNEKAKFEFTWPGITTEEELVLEPGQTDVLRAESTCGKLKEEELTWKSSDESIATVNHEGYVTAKHTTGQCYVTVEYTFMGKVYTATCLIHVKVPAEEISISHRKLKLSVGDTYTLKATVGPKKATIKTVTWYSDNEEIAVVAPDGTITAKRSGAVDIYAVADDGYFKATCHVEVEQ